MEINVAKIISEFGGELRDEYSGRGMYGDKTAAIEFDSESDFYSALAEVMECDIEDREEVAKYLRGRVNIDSMGRGIIVY